MTGGIDGGIDGVRTGTCEWCCGPDDRGRLVDTSRGWFHAVCAETARDELAKRLVVAEPRAHDNPPERAADPQPHEVLMFERLVAVLHRLNPDDGRPIDEQESETDALLDGAGRILSKHFGRAAHEIETEFPGLRRSLGGRAMSSGSRIQRRRSRGWRAPVGSVYVGRPSRWGSPYPVGPSLSAEEAVEAYQEWITAPAQAELLAAARAELVGKGVGLLVPAGGRLPRRGAVTPSEPGSRGRYMTVSLHPRMLERVCRLTPYARAEYATSAMAGEIDDLERATAVLGQGQTVLPSQRADVPGGQSPRHAPSRLPTLCREESTGSRLVLGGLPTLLSSSAMGPTSSPGSLRQTLSRRPGQFRIGSCPPAICTTWAARRTTSGLQRLCWQRR